MKFVPPTNDFGHPIVFGENQPQYNPLPARRNESGKTVVEIEFTADELAAIVDSGRLRLWIHTFNSPLQPLLLETVPKEGPCVES